MIAVQVKNSYESSKNSINSWRIFKRKWRTIYKLREQLFLVFIFFQTINSWKFFPKLEILMQSRPIFENVSITLIELNSLMLRNRDKLFL